MTDTDRRPETIDDLPAYQRERETLARIELAAGGFGLGLGTAVDHLVNAYGEIYADAMTVENVGSTLYVYRDRTEAELADQLAMEQRIWDRKNPKHATEVSADV